MKEEEESTCDTIENINERIDQRKELDENRDLYVDSDENDCSSSASLDDYSNRKYKILDKDPDKIKKIIEDDFLAGLTRDGMRVYWNLPKLHTITKQMCRLPDKETQERIARLELPWKRGRFNADEDRIIHKNWKKLCKKYDVPDNPKIFARWRNTKHVESHTIARKFAIMWLSRNLPERTPAQVYQRFLHTLGLKTKGRFTEEQIAIVEDYMYSKKKGITQQLLAATLGRSERSIWRCIQLLEKKNSTPSKITKWNLNLCNKVVNSLISVVKENIDDKKNVNLKTLRDYKITWSDWKKVGEKVNLSPLSIKIHWNTKLYAMLFSPKPIHYRRIISKLVLIFKKKNYKYWADINWQEVASHFEYIPTLFLYKRFYYVASIHCQSYFTDFNRIIDYLHDKIFIKKNFEIKNTVLQRLAMNKDNQLYATLESM